MWGYISWQQSSVWCQDPPVLVWQLSEPHWSRPWHWESSSQSPSPSPHCLLVSRPQQPSPPRHFMSSLSTSSSDNMKVTAVSSRSGSSRNVTFRILILVWSNPGASLPSLADSSHCYQRIWMRYNFHQFHVLADILKRSLILSYSSLLSLKQSSNFLKTKIFYSGLVKTGLYQLFSKVI